MKTCCTFTICFALFVFTSASFAAPPGSLQIGNRVIEPQGIFGPTFPESLWHYTREEFRENWIQFPSQQEKDIVERAIQRIEIYTAGSMEYGSMGYFVSTPIYLDVINRVIHLVGEINTEGNAYVALQNRHGIDLAYSAIYLGKAGNSISLTDLMANAVPAKPMVKIVFPWRICEPYNKDWNIAINSIAGEQVLFYFDAVFDHSIGAAISTEAHQLWQNSFEQNLDTPINIGVSLLYAEWDETGMTSSPLQSVTPQDYSVNVTLRHTLGGELILADTPTEAQLFFTRLSDSMGPHGPLTFAVDRDAEIIRGTISVFLYPMSRDFGEVTLEMLIDNEVVQTSNFISYKLTEDYAYPGANYAKLEISEPIAVSTGMHTMKIRLKEAAEDESLGVMQTDIWWNKDVIVNSWEEANTSVEPPPENAFPGRQDIWIGTANQ